MKIFLKNIAYSLLPEGLLLRLKKIRNYYTLKNHYTDLVPEYYILSQLIAKGSVVIDLGANIGLFSRCFSLIVGQTGKVYSLEPIPATYQVLCSTMKLLKISNVIPLNYAASNKEMISIMGIPSYQQRHGIGTDGKVYEGKGQNYYEARMITEDSESFLERVAVQTRTVDSLFLDFPSKISFIKCDVEGHELQCILGSLSIIRRDEPMLLIEILNNPNQNGSQAYRLFELLKEEGYAAFYLRDGFLRPYKQNKEVNFFFLKSQHLASAHSLIRN